MNQQSQPKNKFNPRDIDKNKLLKLPRLNPKGNKDEEDEDRVYVPPHINRSFGSELVFEDDTYSYKDYSKLPMKDDHQKRPLYVLPNKTIILETFSPFYKIATEFLVCIAEPRSRPSLIHEYELTKSSLYSAISLKYTSDKIITLLTKLAKTLDIPYEIKCFIRDHTANFGKARCVLNKNKYFIEIDDDEIYEKISNWDVIKEYQNRIIDPEDDNNPGDPSGHEYLEDMINKDENEVFDELEELLQEDKAKDVEPSNTRRIEFDPKDYETIKKRANEMMVPLKEEYEYSIPTTQNPNLPIALKSSTQVRAYQGKALSKMFSNNRAQSGIIVLPCGAGKSLVGVCAASIIKKRTIIFCNSVQSVRQWALQLKTWADIDPKLIIQFVSKGSRKTHQGKIADLILPDKAVIVVTTYTMMHSTKSSDAEEMRRKMQSVEWGLVILDEVHVAPANTFKDAITKIKSHCKLGLTATLLREDNKILNLEYLIGPKLYEENWKDLQNQGFLARVLCVEVRCEMTRIFLQEYQKQTSYWKKMLLYLSNPEKFFALQYLIRYHESRKDKVLVFSDNIFLLTKYAKLLNKMCLHGKATAEERAKVLEYFQRDDKYNVLFLSKIGDTSIDLPDANVLIQISSHFGSRRQEAQRLGRILRPKEKSKSRYNAFFYTIVSLNTQETVYSQKRQTFLIDQGFSFKILTNHNFSYNQHLEYKSTFKLFKDSEQREFLIEILALDDPKMLYSSEGDDDDDDEGEAPKFKTERIKPLGQNILEDMYIEYSEK